MSPDSTDPAQPPPIPQAEPIDPDTSLAAAPEPYLRSLHRGLTLMLAAFVVSLAISLPLAAFFFFLILSRNTTGVAPLAIGFGIVMLIVGTIGWAGQYLLTIPDPRGVWNETFETYRRVLRVLLWCGALSALIGLGFSIVAWNSIFPSRPSALPTSTSPFGIGFFARMTFQLVAAAISLAHVVFLMLYFEQIGHRLHDPWIVARAKMLVWLLPVLMVLFCTLIAPLAATFLQAHLYFKIRSRIGELMTAAHT